MMHASTAFSKWMLQTSTKPPKQTSQRDSSSALRFRKIRNSFRSSVHVGVEVTVDTFLPLLPSHRCHKDWIALHLRLIHCREANEYLGLGWVGGISTL